MTRSRHDEEARVTREVTARAIRRLDILEWVILAGAAVLALVGGWLVAALLSTAVDLPFRWVWIASSVLLMGVPGLITIRRIRSEDRERERRKASQ